MMISDTEKAMVQERKTEVNFSLSNAHRVPGPIGNKNAKLIMGGCIKRVNPLGPPTITLHAKEPFYILVYLYSMLHLKAIQNFGSSACCSFSISVCL